MVNLSRNDASHKMKAIVMTPEHSQQLSNLFDALKLESQEKSLVVVLHIFQRMSANISKLDPLLLDFILQAYGGCIAGIVKDRFSMDMFVLIVDTIVEILDARLAGTLTECSIANYVNSSSSSSSSSNSNNSGNINSDNDGKFIPRFLTLINFTKELSLYLIGEMLVSEHSIEYQNSECGANEPSKHFVRAQRFCYGVTIVNSLIRLIQAYTDRGDHLIVESLYYILALLLKMCSSRKLILQFNQFVEIETFLFHSLANCEVTDFVPNSYVLLHALLSYKTAMIHWLNSSLLSRNTPDPNSNLSSTSNNKKNSSMSSKGNLISRSDMFAFETLEISQVRSMVSDLETVGNIMIKFNFRLVPSMKKLCAICDPNMCIAMYFRELSNFYFEPDHSYARINSYTKTDLYLRVQMTNASSRPCDIYFVYLIIAEHVAFAKELIASNLILNLISEIELSDFNAWGRLPPPLMKSGQVVGSNLFPHHNDSSSHRKALMPVVNNANTDVFTSFPNQTGPIWRYDQMAFGSVVGFQFLLKALSHHYYDFIFKNHSDMFTISCCDIYISGIHGLFNSIANMNKIVEVMDITRAVQICGHDPNRNSNHSTINSGSQQHFHSQDEIELSELIMRIDFAHELTSSPLPYAENHRLTFASVFLPMFDAIASSSFLASHLLYLRSDSFKTFACGGQKEQLLVFLTSPSSSSSLSSSWLAGAPGLEIGDYGSSDCNRHEIVLIRLFLRLFDIMLETTTRIEDKKRSLFLSRRNDEMMGDSHDATSWSDDSFFCFTFSSYSSSIIKLSQILLDSHKNTLQVCFDGLFSCLVFRSIQLASKLFKLLNATDMQGSFEAANKYRVMRAKLYDLNNELVQLVKLVETNLSFCYSFGAGDENKNILTANSSGTSHLDIILEALSLYVNRDLDDDQSISTSSSSSSSSNSSSSSTGSNSSSNRGMGCCTASNKSRGLGLDKSDIDFLGRSLRGPLSLIQFFIFEALTKSVFEFYASKYSGLNQYEVYGSDQNSICSDANQMSLDRILTQFVDFFSIVLTSTSCLFNRQRVTEFTSFFFSSIESNFQSKEGFLSDASLEINMATVASMVSPALSILRQQGPLQYNQEFADSFFVVYFSTMVKVIITSRSLTDSSSSFSANDMDDEFVISDIELISNSFSIAGLSGKKSRNAAKTKSCLLDLSPSLELLESAMAFSIAHNGILALPNDQLRLFSFHVDVCNFLAKTVVLGASEQKDSIIMGPSCLIVMFKLLSMKHLVNISSFSKAFFNYPEWFVKYYSSLASSTPSSSSSSSFQCHLHDKELIFDKHLVLRSFNLFQMIDSVNLGRTLSRLDSYLCDEYALDLTPLHSKMSMMHMVDSPCKIKKDILMMMMACSLACIDKLKHYAASVITRGSDQVYDEEEKYEEEVEEEKDNELIFVMNQMTPDTCMRTIKFFRCVFLLYLTYFLGESNGTVNGLCVPITFLCHHTGIRTSMISHFSNLCHFISCKAEIVINSSSGEVVRGSHANGSSIRIISDHFEFLSNFLDELLYFLFFNFSSKLGLDFDSSLLSTSDIKRDVNTAFDILDWIIAQIGRNELSCVCPVEGGSRSSSSMLPSSARFTLCRRLKILSEAVVCTATLVESFHLTTSSDWVEDSLETVESKSCFPTGLFQHGYIDESKDTVRCRSIISNAMASSDRFFRDSASASATATTSFINPGRERWNDFDDFFTSSLTDSVFLSKEMDRLAKNYRPIIKSGQGIIPTACGATTRLQGIDVSLVLARNIGSYITVVERCFGDDQSRAWEMTLTTLHGIGSPLSARESFIEEDKLFDAIQVPTLCVVCSTLMLLLLWLAEEKGNENSSSKNISTSANDDDRTSTLNSRLLLGKVHSYLTLIQLRAAEISSSVDVGTEYLNHFNSSGFYPSVTSLLLILRTLSGLYCDLFDIIHNARPANISSNNRSCTGTQSSIEQKKKRSKIVCGAQDTALDTAINPLSELLTKRSSRSWTRAGGQSGASINSLPFFAYSRTSLPVAIEEFNTRKGTTAHAANNDDIKSIKNINIAISNNNNNNINNSSGGGRSGRCNERNTSLSSCFALVAKAFAVMRNDIEERYNCEDRDRGGHIKRLGRLYTLFGISFTIVRLVNDIDP